MMKIITAIAMFFCIIWFFFVEIGDRVEPIVTFLLAFCGVLNEKSIAKQVKESEKAKKNCNSSLIFLGLVCYSIYSIGNFIYFEPFAGEASCFDGLRKIIIKQTDNSKDGLKIRKFFLDKKCAVTGPEDIRNKTVRHDKYVIKVFHEKDWLKAQYISLYIQKKFNITLSVSRIGGNMDSFWDRIRYVWDSPSQGELQIWLK